VTRGRCKDLQKLLGYKVKSGAVVTRKKCDMTRIMRKKTKGLQKRGGADHNAKDFRAPNKKLKLGHASSGAARWENQKTDASGEGSKEL